MSTTRSCSATSGSGLLEAVRRGGAVVVTTALLSGVSACTSGDEEGTPTPAVSKVSKVSKAAAVRTIEVRAPVTKVAGRLSDSGRLALRREVEDRLRRYVSQAFVEAGASPQDAFSGFTEGAATMARRQTAALTRSDLGDAVVKLRRAEAAVSAFAPRGKALGATAHVDVVLSVAKSTRESTRESTGEDAPERADRVHLEGRLLLTPVGEGWRVFGFDLRRGGR